MSGNMQLDYARCVNDFFFMAQLQSILLFGDHEIWGLVLGWLCMNGLDGKLAATAVVQWARSCRATSPHLKCQGLCGLQSALRLPDSTQLQAWDLWPRSIVT